VPIDDEIGFALELLEKDGENQAICAHLKGLLELEFCEAAVERVKKVIEKVNAEKETRAVWILAAQIARRAGKLEEYDGILDKLAAIDPVRGRAYNGLKSTSTAFR
jgi:hypothetical protein